MKERDRRMAIKNVAALNLLHPFSLVGFMGFAVLSKKGLSIYSRASQPPRYEVKLPPQLPDICSQGTKKPQSGKGMNLLIRYRFS